MMKYSRLLLLFLLLHQSCQEDAIVTPPEDEVESIEAAKDLLDEASNEELLISEISDIRINGLDYHQILFEDGSRMRLKQSLVQQIEVDEEEWQAKFLFADGCEQLADHLGIIGIDPSAVNLNPFGTAPLTALVNINLPVAGKFEIRVLGKAPDGLTIRHDFDHYGTSHELPVLGLYGDYNNEVELIFKNKEGQARTSASVFIQTEPAIDNATVEVIKNELPEEEQSIYFISNLKAGFDLQGEVRWYYEGDALNLYRKTKNGNLILTGQTGGIHYHRPHFYEVSMLGEVIRRYDVPNFVHHEVIELPNGNFLVATNSTPYTGNRNDGQLEEDMIVEMDRMTGEIVKSWDLNLILDNQRVYPGTNVDSDDWLHLNSLFFDESDQSILLSGKHQSTVAKIDYETGDLIWILAHPSGWSGGQESFVLTPVDEQGDPIDLATMDFLPYYQHSAMLLPNGHLFLYDNGSNRGYYEGTHIPGQDYSRAVEYQINAAERTVQLVWTYSYDPPIFTEATGDVDYHPHNGHRMIGFMQASGQTPKIMELDENNEVLLDVTINRGKYYYRFEKMSLY